MFGVSNTISYMYEWKKNWYLLNMVLNYMWLSFKVYMTQNFFLLYFAVLCIQKPILNLKLVWSFQKAVISRSKQRYFDSKSVAAARGQNNTW